MTITNPAGGEGLKKHDAQVKNAPLSAGPECAEGHRTADTQETAAPAHGGSNGAEGHSGTDPHGSNAPAPFDLPATVEAIRAAHRQRIFWMNRRKSADLSLGAFLRSALGWSLSLPTAERSRINAEAMRLISIGEKYVKAERRAAARAAKKSAGSEGHERNDTQNSPAPPPAELGQFAEIIINAVEMRGPLDALEKKQTEAMEELARTLPVWPLVEHWHGFGALGLAIIVAEAAGRNSRGLDDFATVSKLWKRLGLAVIDGIRMGRLPPGLPREKWAEAWKAQGYDRERRSRVWTVATAVLMLGNPRYREIYLDRKAYERARAEAEGLKVVPAAQVPAKDKDKYRTLGHVDRRARRYAEKALVCDLWIAWRQAASAGGEGQYDNDTQKDDAPPPAGDYKS